MEKVKIEVKNNRQNEDPIEVVYLGSLMEKEKETHIAYNESVLTGMEGVKTVLIINDNHLEIIRTGNIRSKMIFKEKYRDNFVYRMNEGAMSMALETDELSVGRQGKQIDIYIRYRLEIAGDQADRNEMRIRITRN
ncbi:DUF1934 domain-containing protein [Proteiniclasticum sp. SCR006]|uniref:DUF1934 domain-containing protein n=1 Tax=Proteiniclasticum aestuarii TaxID=2817862 RepID=A0A939H9M8_9CLOT|nr:DUF1934 domain-containing protein [Proteiniclasticum aestuarii]MBO1263932.1 DUF1934 domain-containing protein [Proteiniclasticum aestuarii]